jgi:hypothetical protein
MNNAQRKQNAIKWIEGLKKTRAKHPELPYSSITARPAALEQEGLIYYKGDKRDGCRVMRAKGEV